MLKALVEQMKQNHETITVNTKILKMGGVALWLTEGLAIHEIQYVNFVFWICYLR